MPDSSENTCQIRSERVPDSVEQSVGTRANLAPDNTCHAGTYPSLQDSVLPADSVLPSGLTLMGVSGDIPRKVYGLNHPQSGNPTPDDNSEVKNPVRVPASPGIQIQRPNIDRRYSERVDGFRKKILLKYEKHGRNHRLFLNLALDIIDQRAWDAGKRIASQRYFETAFENLDSKTIHIIKRKLDAGRYSPEDIFLIGELSPESEEARRAFIGGNRDLLDLPHTRKKLIRAVNFKELRVGRA